MNEIGGIRPMLPVTWIDVQWTLLGPSTKLVVRLGSFCGFPETDSSEWGSFHILTIETTTSQWDDKLIKINKVSVILKRNIFMNSKSQYDHQLCYQQMSSSTEES